MILPTNSKDQREIYLPPFPPPLPIRVYQRWGMYYENNLSLVSTHREVTFRVFRFIYELHLLRII